MRSRRHVAACPHAYICILTSRVAGITASGLAYQYQPVFVQTSQHADSASLDGDSGTVLRP